MVADGATHVGVATDHVIESFRNDLWSGYKTGEGVPAELAGAVPHPRGRAGRPRRRRLRHGASARRTTRWPRRPRSAAADPGVEQVIICTPDKDLAQCVSGRRVVQLDRRKGAVIDEQGVWDKFGVAPASIPDWLALVGDSADGFPGIAGWGRRSAAVVLAHYGHIGADPRRRRRLGPGRGPHGPGGGDTGGTIGVRTRTGRLFLDLATLRPDPPVLATVEDLRWAGPTEDFAAVCAFLGDDDGGSRRGIAPRHTNCRRDRAVTRRRSVAQSPAVPSRLGRNPAARCTARALGAQRVDLGPQPGHLGPEPVHLGPRPRRRVAPSAPIAPGTPLTGACRCLRRRRGRRRSSIGRAGVPGSGIPDRTSDPRRVEGRRAARPSDPPCDRAGEVDEPPGPLPARPPARRSTVSTSPSPSNSAMRSVRDRSSPTVCGPRRSRTASRARGRASRPNTSSTTCR